MPEAIRPVGKDAAVLIVGGGPVGLALAAELARLGVTAILTEARDGVIRSPKMNYVNVRSMEFCRRWGITDEVRAAGHKDSFHPNALWVTAVTGHEIARMEFQPFLQQKSRLYSPAAACLVSQLRFDPILLAHARTQDALTILHRTRLDDFTESEDGIEARVTDLASGEARVITASYIVGCDGARSTVRERLGIELEGQHAIQNNFHVFVHSDALIDLFETHLTEARFCNLIGPNGIWAVITSIDWRGHWRVGLHPPPEDESIVPDLLRKAVGRDFDFEILGSAHWLSQELVASAYRKGRAFIAGDAAHQNTPEGGFGMNTGVGDVIDLAWKLWASLSGWGGPLLLDSYEAERRPVAKRNAQQATHNLMRRRRLKPGALIDTDGEEGARQRAEYRAALLDAGARGQHDVDGIALGYRYDASPVIWPDGTEAPDDAVSEFAQTARPGHRAPHAWLRDAGDGGHRASTLDLFGDGFVLLTFAAAADAIGFEQAAAARGLPLRVSALSDPEIAALYGAPMVLVRPDGHVAWRGRDASAAAAIIDRARGAP